MLAVQGEDLIFGVAYSEDGIRKTGLTVVLYLYEVPSDGSSPTLIVDGGACVEVGHGFYKYRLAGASVDAKGAYWGVFHTETDTVDQQDIPASWTVGYANSESIDNILEDTGTTLPAEINAVETDVWTHEDRTLTMSAQEVTAAVEGSTISRVRGDTWVIQMTDVTLDANKQQFIMKKSYKYGDDEAYLFVDSDAGLLVLNGSDEVTAENASLAYDAGTEVLTLTVTGAVTAQLRVGSWKYAAQSVAEDETVKEGYQGTFVVLADYVNAVA